jgi:hypothetical protein
MKFALLNTTCSQLDIHVQLFALISGPNSMINTKKYVEYCQRTKGYPRVDNDLLMFAASFKRSPSAPELFCLV